LIGCFATSEDFGEIGSGKLRWKQPAHALGGRCPVDIRPFRAAAPLAWAAPVFVMTDMRGGLPSRSTRFGWSAAVRLGLATRLERRDPRMPTGALRISPTSSGRLVLDLGRFARYGQAKTARLS
jgi:hypothetical protein